MFLPLRIKTDRESLLLVTIAIPLMIKFKMGLKSINTIKSDDGHLSISEVEDKNCLHVYAVYFKFRIRSKEIMDYIGHAAKRILISHGNGWTQLFDSAII